MQVFYKIFFLFSFLLFVQYCTAQLSPQPGTDTLRTIEIIRAKNQRQITIDSATVLQTLAGAAAVRQGSTILYGDSIILNQLSGVAEVFGNVHINDGDTMHTYAQYLKYLGNERIAYLDKSVKLTDGKASLTTENLVYNLATGIADYTNGGKVINGTTVLTSEGGTYYSDAKEAVFRNNVHLVDPNYDMRADSLRYNTAFKTAYFISPTHIISKDGVIDTKSGSYNLETGNAIFDSNSSFRDSSRYIKGDKMAYDKNTGVIQVEGHGKFVDSANNVIVLGEQLLIDKKSSTFLATRKPVMILYRDNDSTYITADTLFSGIRKYDSTANKPVVKNESIKTDSTVTISQPTAVAPPRLKRRMASDTAVQDTAVAQIIPTAQDSLKTDSISPVISQEPPVIADTVKKDTAMIVEKQKDSIPALVTTTDTLKQPTTIDVTKVPKDSIRYFLGFHHVRIYNDSLQAVSDSMYYSTEDSTFKLFGSPVCWNDQTQVKGDTMHLYTENQKAKRMYVYFNAIAINKTKEGFYNQMGGRTINGYFKEGSLDYIRVKGSPAESIFYPHDDDSAYVGMNRSKGDVIDFYFVNKELNKIKFINDVDGTLFPLKQIPADLKLLKNFNWEDKRRPKNKLELFE